MMLALIEDSNIVKYPISLSDLKKKFPLTSFPSSIDGFNLSDFGAVKVEPTVKPTIDPETQELSEGTPELIDGIWKQKWIIQSLSEEERQRILEDKKCIIRSRRDGLLTETDWTQSRDVTLDNDADWISYRQALRDITTQEGFPHNVTWPTKP